MYLAVWGGWNKSSKKKKKKTIIYQREKSFTNKVCYFFFCIYTYRFNSNIIIPHLWIIMHFDARIKRKNVKYI